MTTTTTTTATPITSARKSRASRAAEKTAEQTTPQPTPTPKPEPVKHEVTIDLGLTQTPTWRPVAVVDGETVACIHTRYGHETEAAAKRCINSVVRAATS